MQADSLKAQSDSEGIQILIFVILISKFDRPTHSIQAKEVAKESR
jgi:hypothetical protein